MSSNSIVLTVSQITQAIKLHLERQFPKVVVQGEISNFKKQYSNHLYFTLKDAKSQIQCAMFASDARFLKQLPKDGDQVKVMGEINVYLPRGNYQIIVRSLQPAGVGELLMLLEERKERFRQKGYFEASLKKKLPKFPKKIGVITSPTGAVISDILQILRRRAHGFHLLLNPVKVQGTTAAAEISRAIDDFNRLKLADVLIVARGGGSLEDLWPFNEEAVVESLYKSQIPVVSAVGHETDTTLCDLAADLRAPTPSAAAELVMGEKEAKWQFLQHCQTQMDHVIQERLQHQSDKLKLTARNPFIQSPQKLLEIYSQQVDEACFKVDQHIERRLNFYQESLQKVLYQLHGVSPEKALQQKRYYLKILLQQLDFKLSKTIEGQKNKFNNLWTHLRAINPQKVLEKGYSIVFDEKSKRAIVSTQDIALKQKLKLILKDGTVDTVVQHIQDKNDKTKTTSI